MKRPFRLERDPVTGMVRAVDWTSPNLYNFHQIEMGGLF